MEVDKQKDTDKDKNATAPTEPVLWDLGANKRKDDEMEQGLTLDVPDDEIEDFVNAETNVALLDND